MENGQKRIALKHKKQIHIISYLWETHKLVLLVILQETQTGWVNTVNKAIEKFPNTSFIQSAGDQVNNSNSEEEYTGFFAPELLKKYPTATTIGNHDNSQLL